MAFPTPTSANYNIFSLVPDKMERGNYLCWKNQFECALRVHKLLHFILGTESVPARKLENEEDNSAYEEWETKDNLVLEWLKATVSNPYQLMLLKCKSAFEGWNTSEKLISPMSKTQVQVIRDQLNNLKKASTDSM